MRRLARLEGYASRAGASGDGARSLVRAQRLACITKRACTHTAAAAHRRCVVLPHVPCTELHARAERTRPEPLQACSDASTCAGASSPGAAAPPPSHFFCAGRTANLPLSVCGFAGLRSRLSLAPARARALLAPAVGGRSAITRAAVLAQRARRPTHPAAASMMRDRAASTRAGRARLAAEAAKAARVIGVGLGEHRPRTTARAWRHSHRKSWQRPQAQHLSVSWRAHAALAPHSAPYSRALSCCFTHLRAAQPAAQQHSKSDYARAH